MIYVYYVSRVRIPEFERSHGTLAMIMIDHGWLARSCMVMVALPRSWHMLARLSRILHVITASKELAMDLGKATMASNTGIRTRNKNEIPFSYHKLIVFTAKLVVSLTFPPSRELRALEVSLR